MELLFVHHIDFSSSWFHFHLSIIIFWLPFWFLQWSFDYLASYYLAIFFLFFPCSVQFISVQSLNHVSLWPHESQHTRPPCPSPTRGVHSDSSPSSQWCHPDISPSVVPFSSCPQSLPASVWQEYTGELYKKELHNPDNHDGVITHLESYILECEVKWVLESITMNKASGGNGIPVELFQSWTMTLWKCYTQYANKVAFILGSLYSS